ncbi:tyrosine-type recombinase/integrase [Candidatus Uabimicrobium sp. HlEnr_7]|uniref:tyrosine-type recombinase/integrase n=1 Tax=Candidatus Uabimicrobium helgolandensis TaxID=3095367 RepID=UPI0035592112
MKIDTLLDAFCRKQILKGCTPRTIKWYKNSFRYFANTTKIKNIEDISQYHLEVFFFEGTTQNKWKDTTYLAYYKAIKSFLKWCTEEGYFEDNPIAKVGKPSGKNQYVPEYFSEEKVVRILNALTSLYENNRFLFVRNYAIISTFVHSGIRKNELLKLEDSDIQIDNGIILVRASKWNKDREIPIPDNLVVALKRYTIEKNRRRSYSNKFFISYVGRELTESCLRGLFEKLKNTLGFGISSHRFRHTYATILVRSGVDLKTVARLLGHSNIKTTLIYTHIADDHLKQIIRDKLPRFV